MSARRSRLAMVALASLAGGALAGAIVGAIGYSVYLVLVSPAIAAIAAGLVTGAAAHTFKAPSPRVVAVIGVVSGLVSMAAILVVTLQIERSRVISELSQTAGLSDAAIERAVERWQRTATGDAGAATAFVELRLRSGARLFGDARIDWGAGLNGGLLLLEILLSGLLAGRLARSRAAEPFCDNCDAWYSRRIVGAAPLGALSSVRAELQAGRYHRLGRRLAPPSTQLPVVLHGYMCDTCSMREVIFELEVSEAGRRPRVIKTVEAPHDALDAILDSQALSRSG